MAIFGRKPWVNAFGKMSIFRLFDFLVFYSLERRFFISEYRKRHFSGLYSLNKKLQKCLFLHQNHGLSPLEKCQIFDFELLIWRFFVLEYRKTHFPGLYCLKKKVGKMAIFGPKPWVNPFGKM